MSAVNAMLILGVLMIAAGCWCLIRTYHMFTLSRDCELAVVLSLFAAMFLPFSTGIAAVDFLLYLLKVLAALFLLTLLRATTARLRINQIVTFCWKYLTPLALVQIVLNLILRGALLG